MMSKIYLFITEIEAVKLESAYDSIRLPHESPKLKFSRQITLHMKHPFILYDRIDVWKQKIQLISIQTMNLCILI